MKTLLGFLLVVMPVLQAAEPPRPLPVSAHNCYPQNSAKNDRLVEALALGIDNIEIDLGWDAEKRRLIVGHDAEPKPGTSYPEFESYLVPALEAHWKTHRTDGAPTVLTIDWKTGRPEAVLVFRDFLDAHPDWFSSAPKAGDSPLTRRRLTVCFTGGDAAKAAYDALVPPGGLYRAFRDEVFGAGGGYRERVVDYAPEPATAYHRFLTFHWGQVERGAPLSAGDWTAAESDRLASLVAHVHEQGFRARFYCLNGHTGILLGPYRFRDDAAAQVRWRAAADAGADWVASDEYEEVVRALRERGAQRRSPKGTGTGPRTLIFPAGRDEGPEPVPFGERR